MNLHRIIQIDRVPACNNDCSQGRGDCPTPEACRLPEQIKHTAGANLDSWRAQVHETANQVERAGVYLCLSATVALISMPDEWLLAIRATVSALFGAVVA